MKQLKFKFDLSHKVAIYVPGTTGVNIDTDSGAQVERVMREFSGWFGGATASDARGGWLSPSAGLVLEKITIVYAFCSDGQLQGHIDDVIALAAALRDEMTQEAVTVEVNGQIAFI